MSSPRWKKIHEGLWLDLSRVIAVTISSEDGGRIVTLHMDNGTKHRVTVVTYAPGQTVSKNDQKVREWLKDTLGLDMEGTQKS
jgi:hypothetical protein